MINAAGFFELRISSVQEGGRNRKARKNNEKTNKVKWTFRMFLCLCPGARASAYTRKGFVQGRKEERVSKRERTSEWESNDRNSGQKEGHVQTCPFVLRSIINNTVHVTQICLIRNITSFSRFSNTCAWVISKWNTSK